MSLNLSLSCLGFRRMDKHSLEKLAEASAAEAEVASAVWQSAQAASATPEEASLSDVNSQSVETTSEGSDTEVDVRLHPRAVCFELVLLCINILYMDAWEP